VKLRGVELLPVPHVPMKVYCSKRIRALSTEAIPNGVRICELFRWKSKLSKEVVRYEISLCTRVRVGYADRLLLATREHIDYQ
jgi:hypothetical protein